MTCYTQHIRHKTNAQRKAKTMLRTFIVKTTDGTVIVKSDSDNMADVQQEALLAFDYPEFVRVVSIVDVDSIGSTIVL